MKKSKYQEPFEIAANTYYSLKRGEVFTLNGTHFCLKYKLNEEDFLKYESEQFNKDLYNEQKINIELCEKKLQRELTKAEKFKVNFETRIKFKKEKYGILFWLRICQYYVGLDNNLRNDFIKIVKE